MAQRRRPGLRPDGYLYVTTGDARRAELAQDPASPAGSLLRLTDEGESPPDNPGHGPVWSWGHRNVQGLAWDDEGRLWATEHGRSGLRSGLDEVNLIEPGRNYGWPAVEGDDHGDPFEAPVLHSGPDHTWAPAGAAWLEGSLFFGGLRGEALYQARMQSDEVLELRAHFYGEFGRIRAVTVGPDGGLYFTTSNRDGRGRTRDGDDRVVRIGLEEPRELRSVTRRVMPAAIR
jgi:glucose/arabinose dehydrogenase